MEEKNIQILRLLDEIIIESTRNDVVSRIEKAQKGIYGENGDSFVTFHLKQLRELLLSK